MQVVTVMSSEEDNIGRQEAEDMQARAQVLVENISSVLQRIRHCAPLTSRPVRLVAVSKLKPATDILALHNASRVTGHDSHFGENYVQELLEKAQTLPRDIHWHFIGSLQTNKCKTLASSIPNLWAIESVDSIKKADALERGRVALLSTLRSGPVDKLRVFVQVNTSGEGSKSGCEPSEAFKVAKHIIDSCPNLSFKGLMTIGAVARSKQSDVPNEDFILLRKTRDEIAEALGIAKEEVELSMGMSEDFESAIGEGATNVRVGSTIFGARPPKTTTQAKVKSDVELSNT